MKFVQRNFFTPVPEVKSLAELNALLRQRCLAYQEQMQSRQTETVGARLEAEKMRFLPLTPVPARMLSPSACQSEQNVSGAI